MVNVYQQVTHLNGLLINHSESHIDSPRCPQPITDLVNHLRTTLITSPKTEIYDTILKIYETEYDDSIIIENFMQIMSPTPLLNSDRSQPYIDAHHLSKHFTTLISRTTLYLDNFTPSPQSIPEPSEQVEQLEGSGGRL